jgi:hypothetical protein
VAKFRLKVKLISEEFWSRFPFKLGEVYEKFDVSEVFEAVFVKNFIAWTFRATGFTLRNLTFALRASVVAVFSSSFPIPLCR